MRGHSVLQIPVPALEAFVLARTRHYDDSFVSADPAFGHAHITALAPFLDRPTPADLAGIGRIAADTEPFAVRLEVLGQFPDGIIHLRPEPPAPLLALTRRLMAAYPSCPPYGGAFPRVVPHLTLDLAAGEVDLTSTRLLLGDAIPAVSAVDRLQLAWYQSDACRVLQEWRLGSSGPDQSRPDRSVGTSTA